MTITEFIQARLSEEEAQAETEQDRREIAAKRAILKHYNVAGYDPTANYARVGTTVLGTIGFMPPPVQIICTVA